MTKVKHALLPVIVLAAALAPSLGNATTYKFRVSCERETLIEEWNTGEIDPGQEYLRVVTGTHHPNCNIDDFNANRDFRLRTERHSDLGGILFGIPGSGIVCAILGCWRS